MSDVPPKTGLGLGLTIDPEILTREVDHDFFDDPPEAVGSIDIKMCQPQGVTDSSKVGMVCKAGESGRSSSNMTVHLEMEKKTEAGVGVAEAEFYSIHQSNATSPNYPRPKQCYQLQQRRRSLGSIKKPDGQQYHPMNSSDCGLTGGFFPDDDVLSGSSSSLSPSSSSSDLSDSSESELESLGSDDEEFVDMLEKYFDYIEESDTDCSDLTEVSPLSSLSASPLPGLFAGVEEAVTVSAAEAVIMLADMSLLSNNRPCSSPTPEFQVEALEELSSTAKDVIYNLSHKGQVDWSKPKLPEFISTTESIILPEIMSEKLGGAEGNNQQVFEKGDLSSPEIKGFVKGQPDKTNSSPTLNDDSMSSSSGSTTGWSLSSSSTASLLEKGRAASSANSSTLGGAKRLPKNFTFTPDQMRKIDRENHILLRKILDTNNGRNGHVQRHRNGHNHAHHHHQHHHKPAASSTSIARLRQQRRIEHENNILMRRLQTVKPSKDIEDAFGKQPVKN